MNLVKLKSKQSVTDDVRAIESPSYPFVKKRQSSYTIALIQGVFDDEVRYSIAMNIIATKKFCQRVIKQGEQQQRVFEEERLGDKNIRRLNLFKREKLEVIPKRNMSEGILG